METSKDRLHEVEENQRKQELENALIYKAQRAAIELRSLPPEQRNDLAQLSKIMQRHFAEYRGIISFTLFKHKIMTTWKTHTKK